MGVRGDGSLSGRIFDNRKQKNVAHLLTLQRRIALALFRMAHRAHLVRIRGFRIYGKVTESVIRRSEEVDGVCSGGDAARRVIRHSRRRSVRPGRN